MTRTATYCQSAYGGQRRTSRSCHAWTDLGAELRVYSRSSASTGQPVAPANQRCSETRNSLIILASMHLGASRRGGPSVHRCPPPAGSAFIHSHSEMNPGKSAAI